MANIKTGFYQIFSFVVFILGFFVLFILLFSYEERDLEVKMSFNWDQMVIWHVVQCCQRVLKYLKDTTINIF